MSWHSEGFDEEENDDVQDFLALCDEVLELIEELPEAAEDFADSIEEKVTSMREFVETSGRVTGKMSCAVENMKIGVEKWLR